MAAFGLAETAELAVRISLKDDLSRGIDGLTTKVGRLQTGLGKVGTGLKTAARNLAGPTLVAGGLLGFAIKGGLDDLSELESAVTSVDGAIKTMGLTGKVTGKQVADWANEIEAATGAAFDDKAITLATANLIRYGKVTEKNLLPAMEVMTDLAAKTGDVESASNLLGKALAAPEKAAGKLARMGIILTKAQQKQLKAMVEAGDAAGAQALLLDILAQSTKGAAEASQGKYAKAMSVLADVQEDARKALAEGFLPVLEKVASLLSTELAKPQTLKNIREFGEGLAAGLDSVIEIARNLPWGTIGDSLKIAGAGAKAILSAFTSLPPWVQTAVLTGWGLNKLTGGMLGDIAGSLVKGVLGIRAGVVNVSGPIAGGGGAGAAGAAGGAGKLAKIGNAVRILGAVSIAGASIAALAQTYMDVNQQSSEHAQGVSGTLDQMLANNPTLTEMLSAQRATRDGINAIQSNPLLTLVQGSALDTLKSMDAKLAAEIVKEQAGVTATQNAQSIASRENAASQTKIDAVQRAVVAAQVANAAMLTIQAAGQAIRDATQKSATTTAGLTAASASRSAGDRTAAAQYAAASRIVGAIWAARPVIQPTNVIEKYTTIVRTGSPSGSRRSGPLV